jgi:hypothetical protein
MNNCTPCKTYAPAKSCCNKSTIPQAGMCVVPNQHPVSSCPSCVKVHSTASKGRDRVPMSIYESGHISYCKTGYKEQPFVELSQPIVIYF